MTLTAFGHSQTEVGPGDDVEVSLAGVEVAMVHECNLGHRPLITPCRLERNRGDDVDCALVEQLVIKKEEEKEKGGGGSTHGQCSAVSVAVPCVCATFLSPRHCQSRLCPYYTVIGPMWSLWTLSTNSRGHSCSSRRGLHIVLSWGQAVEGLIVGCNVERERGRR